MAFGHTADDEQPKDPEVFVGDHGPEPEDDHTPEDNEPEQVVLVADSLPFYVSDFTLPRDDGSTLVFDRRGTRVAADEVDSLIETAAVNGVALTRKAN